jgi:hypothetical protein
LFYFPCVINFSFFISVKMCSVSPVDELHALGQTLVKINMFIQKKQLTISVLLCFCYTPQHIAGLEFGKNKGKASLALNVTKFFRASRPVYRASRPVWKFYSVAILKFQITFELPWENKNIQNSSNILKNAKWNYSYHSHMYRNYLQY